MDGEPGARPRRGDVAAAGAGKLRGCDRVGAGARVVGTPYIQNRGRITIGEDFHLRSMPVTSHFVVGRGATLEIGRAVEIGHGFAAAANLRITIGDNVRIAPFVMIMDGDFHEVGNFSAAPECRPIEIGAGARIGARVTILRGAVIGAGARVAAGSVVSGFVPPGAEVAGVPARRARPRPARTEGAGT